MAFDTLRAKVDIINSLLWLRKSVEQMGEIPHDKTIYDYGVNFFNYVNVFGVRCDFNPELFSDMPDVSGRLAELLRAARGIDQGWVRVQDGEAVSLYNMYLGNVAGLDLKPAIKYKQLDHKYEYIQTHIRHQLRNLVRTYRGPVLDLSNEFLDHADRLERRAMWLAWLARREYMISTRIEIDGSISLLTR